MPLRFAMLASGSSGNAGWLQVGSYGLLIDAGLGPRLLAQRLSAVGAHWREVSAVLVTHTHGDHWKEKTFRHLQKSKIPIYCHAHHRDYLSAVSLTFSKMEANGLVQSYQAGQALSFGSRLRCFPLPLRHDDRATFGFRFDVLGESEQSVRSMSSNGNDCSIPPLTTYHSPVTSFGYLTDLGCWDGALVRALKEVDLLALEFNHDVIMERNSNRSEYLIARVLGDDGHLSNDQAAQLLDAILRQSAPQRLQHLVQLHLSRECNRTTLAVQAARAVRARHAARFQIHTALQSQAGPSITIHGVRRPAMSTPVSSTATLPSATVSIQPFLPGCE